MQHISDDVVYMEDEELRKEYIENDVGKVWQGSWRRYSGKPWVLGQFDDAVLPACCFVLQKSKLRPGERGNAVKVARAISAMVRLDCNFKPYYDGDII
jgi:transglutaminase 1